MAHAEQGERRDGSSIPAESLRPGDHGQADMKALIRLAHDMGASEAGLIGPVDIPVEEKLAALCSAARCDDYGQSPSCPPHVSGPSGFRELQKRARHALVFRITVPSAVLFSSERRDVMQLLHEIAATVEQAAVRAGYPHSRAFAGGSCKKIFCHAHADCAVLSQQGPCRNPQSARPSMSGFGINVLELMQRCGWPANIARNPETGGDAMSWVAGLVLIG